MSAAISSISTSAPVPRRVEDVAQRPDVRAERGEALGQVLRVAHRECTEVNSGIREPSSAGIGSPARSISAHSPTAVSVTVLPPAFGPGDHQRARVAPSARTSLATTSRALEHQQRVAQPQELQRAVGRPQLRGGRAEVGAQLRRGLGLVQLGGGVDALQ